MRAEVMVRAMKDPDTTVGGIMVGGMGNMKIDVEMIDIDIGMIDMVGGIEMSATEPMRIVKSPPRNMGHRDTMSFSTDKNTIPFCGCLAMYRSLVLLLFTRFFLQELHVILLFKRKVYSREYYNLEKLMVQFKVLSFCFVFSHFYSQSFEQEKKLLVLTR